jgi:Ca-activated chloride channel family protein
MTFAHRELLWLIALAPAVMLIAAWFWRRRIAATRTWASHGMWERLRFGYRRRRLLASLSLLALAVAATGIALAHPRWGEVEERVEREGVDIVFVVDSSLSMSAADLPPSRMYVAQALVRSLVRQLPGNRVALVQAEGEGVVMAPLTVDRGVMDLLLDTVAPGTLPVPGTGLAHALELAIELFPEESEKHRVVLLLSDGEDHEGGLDQVAQDLRKNGIVLHSLGIGTLRGSPLPLPNGGPNELKRDREGNVIVSKLEEASLRAVASGTGGSYTHVEDAGVDLSDLMSEVRTMETRSFAGEVLTTQESRFQWPLLLAVTALTLFLAVAPVTRARERTS